MEHPHLPPLPAPHGVLLFSACTPLHWDGSVSVCFCSTLPLPATTTQELSTCHHRLLPACHTHHHCLAWTRSALLPPTTHFAGFCSCFLPVFTHTHTHMPCSGFPTTALLPLPALPVNTHLDATIGTCHATRYCQGCLHTPPPPPPVAHTVLLPLCSGTYVRFGYLPTHACHHVCCCHFHCLRIYAATTHACHHIRLRAARSLRSHAVVHVSAGTLHAFY